jgi:hypothetical protein
MLLACRKRSRSAEHVKPVVPPITGAQSGYLVVVFTSGSRGVVNAKRDNIMNNYLTWDEK